MALHGDGRFAAITNYREGVPGPAAPRSRGELVSGFLAGTSTAEDFFRQAASRNNEYNPYSMIAGDLESLHFHSNRIAQPQTIAPGVHGLSNHLLNTPWPKVTTGTAALSSTTEFDDPDAISSVMFPLLLSDQPAPDLQLPDTGITRQREKELSPPFIRGEHYGTRTSTVVLVNATGDVFFHEKRFGPGGVPASEDARAFRIQRAAA